ncbi:MAG TPA: outer membrane protein assembly factor BamA [Stellaceae bacterium]|nr:outer membrane protein assembly factor BamA [Stellaceae bacterium]
MVAAVVVVGVDDKASAASLQTAQIQEGGTVQEVRVEGTERIEPETVRSYLVLQAGDTFENAKIDQSLKALFATGLFADVTLRRDGNALIVRVVENPIINRVAFEGNSKYDDKALTDEVQLKPRTVYTRTRVQADVKRILDLYRRGGRFAATVEPKVVQLPQNRVDLIFEIDEGSTTGIRSINFVGNQNFDTSELLPILSTKESRWYRFFSTDDTYDPDRLTYDRELLRKFYLQHGYADFRVVSAVAELTPAKDGFIVTFTIDEGERYKFGKIDLDVKLKALTNDELRPLLLDQPGDWYNADDVEKTIAGLTDAVGTKGYAFIDIQPQINRSREAHTIDITYVISEASRVYVERIDINGNVRTLDKVIRREFLLAEGDAFNTSKLRRSQQRIKDLGFFKKAEVTNTPGSAPDRTVVNVNVEEQSTGELSIGAGYSTSDGVLGNFGIRERNLLGRGQDLRLNGTLSQRSSQIDLSFTEPYFLDHRVAAGFDLFATNRNNQKLDTYSQFSVGGVLRLGYQITDNLRQTLRYTLRNDTITNISTTASPYIQAEKGGRTTSAVGQTLLYDRRDNRQDPTEGYFISFDTSVAGLAGNTDYVKGVVQGATYYSIVPEWVITVSGEGGYVQGTNGQPVHLSDRFFIGGDNLRGFSTGGVGPHDVNTSDSLGGNKYYLGSTTLDFPLGLPKEFGVTGRVFTDFGSLFSLDQHGPGIADSAALRVSTGFGISWKSPLGPIKLDLGIPIKKQPSDSTEIFRVGFGTRF